MSLKIGDMIGGALRGTAVGLAGQVVSALLMSGRSIGGIIPDVTIEEHHTDTIEITAHPVEKGAPITDHAYVNPAEVTMRVAWSNSRSIANAVVSGTLLTGSISTANDLYRKLLDLQSSLKAFDLVTGKRTYKNMLIKSLATTSDSNSENALVVTAILRQILVVETDTVTLAPAEDHASPASTAAVASAGTKQAIKAPNQSALYTLFH